MLGPERVDVLGPEALVHRAVTLPQEQGRRFEGGIVEASALQTRVPHCHVGACVPEFEPGVAAQVLIGEEQHLVAGTAAAAVPECPGQHGPGIRGRAHHATVPSDEGLQRRRRVHVGHRNDPIDVGHRSECLPGFLHRLDVGHVGHRAPGVEVRQDHLLVRARQDVGRLGHEVDATEHHELRLGLAGGDPGQPEGVSPGVGPGHHLVPLVVVPEDDQSRTEFVLGLPDPGSELRRIGCRVAIRKGRL